MRQSAKTRLLYGVGYVLYALAASFAMAPFAQEFVERITPEAGPTVCESEEPGGCPIYGTLAVFRLSLALAVYHGFLAAATVRVAESDDPIARFHNGRWAVKALLLSGLVAAFWFVPTDFYITYGYIAMSAAFVFAVVQSFCLLGTADAVNAHYVSIIEDTGARAPVVVLLALTTVAAGLAVALASVVLAYFGAPVDGADQGACALNNFYGAFALILGVAGGALCLLPTVQERRPKMGILHAAVVAAYVAYLTYAATAGQPASVYPCDQFPNAAAEQVLGLVVGGAFLVLAMWYWIVLHGSASNDDADTLGERLRVPIGDVNGGADGATGSSGGGGGGDDDERYGVVYSYSKFHLVLAGSTAYLAMLVTNWNMLERADLGRLVESEGLPAMWLKWTAALLSALLYYWILLAPALFPDRDFS